MTDAHADDAQRTPPASASSPQLALATLQQALREATVALGQRALAQHSEAAVRADAVLAHGLSRLKSHLSAAGDGPHASEASMSENTDHDDTAATPHPGANLGTTPGTNANPGAAANTDDAPAGADPAAPGTGDAPAEPAPEELLERLRAALAGDRAPYHHDGLNQQIVSAIKLSNEAVLGAAGEFAYGHRAATDAFATGLRKISDAQHRQNLQTLQAAALAVCLDAMLKQPECADDYAGLLEAIKQLV